MNKLMTGRVILAGAVLSIGMPASAAASGGIIGDCGDCHTMHNSEQGKPVAIVGFSSSPSATPIVNLLRMDCIACHAADPSGNRKIVDLGGGSQVPQVMHQDPSGDLAGGNFGYIISGGNRKGHNVVDLVSADTENQFPPGHRHKDNEIGIGGFDVQKFTCAGYMGCHGFRGQALSSYTVICDEFYYNEATGLPCTPEEIAMSGIEQVSYRTGISALSGYDGAISTSQTLTRGAHHRSFDGLKKGNLDPDFYNNSLATSYRFIRAVQGYGNEVERWQNNSSTSHNEYVGGYESTAYGNAIKTTDYLDPDQANTPCSRCHTNGQSGTTSKITVPGQSTTGFCLTCHGLFHSPGIAFKDGKTNGESGAFLRHPSDYVIPDWGEYSSYTEYNVTAPVARPHSVFVDGMVANDTVHPGEDLVMCLSCHMAHASPYDAMLRFNYTEQIAGYASTGLNTGCLGCHTTKG